MKKEHCFGIIPLIKRENSWEIFLVEHKKGRYFGFPKGHGEKGESPKESAERELKEETSMTVIRYLPSPFLEQTYQFERDGEWIHKNVKYYLAEVTPHYEQRSHEIIQGKWVALKDLLSFVKFEEDTKLFKEVIDLLSD